MGLFFHSRSEGVTVIDVVSAMYFNGSIVIWFVNKVMLQKEKAAYNLGDWFILAFFFFLIFNFIIAYINQANLFTWIREYLVISLVLLYFPIKSIIKTEEELKKFLAFFAVVLIGVGIYQGYLYYTKLNEIIIQYAFELSTGVNVNQTIYTTATIFGFVFTFHQVKKKNEIQILIFTGFMLISLIATFSRTFWVILAVFIGLMFVFFPAEKKISIVKYLIFLFIIFFALAFLLMKENLFLYLQVILERFTSSADGTRDMSVVARLVEWETLFKKIGQHPLSGSGLGKVFTFYSPIQLFTYHTDVIHNGFLFIIYRVGIPTALLYFAFIIFYNIKAYNNLILSIKFGNNFELSLGISTFVCYLVLYIANITSAQYFYRDGLIVVSLLCFFTDYLGR
ncbi:MAG TPA: O-antigen ligase family protein, partial [Candidatus Kapabacteria bacterium]|nr:O-antigen ligase family protein [Candidatus Kapabacteria bacterium]